MKKLIKRSPRATTSRTRSAKPSAAITAFIVTLGLFANLFSFLIATPVNAAGTSVSLDAFRLDASMSINSSGEQTGAGEFDNGSLANYIEGACVPLHIQVVNSNEQSENIGTNLQFDFSSNHQNIDNIEIVNVTETNIESINDLNDFEITNNTLASAGGLVTAVIRGTNQTFDVNVSAPTFTATTGTYTLGFTNVPAAPGKNQKTIVDLFLCARLGVNASENQGAELDVRLGNGGSETVAINPNQTLPLPTLVINKSVVNSTNGAVVTPSNFTFSVSPSPVAAGTTQFTMPIAGDSGNLRFENVFPGTYEIAEVNVPNNFNVSISPSTPAGTCVANTQAGDANATATLPTPTSTTLVSVACNFVNTATAPNNPPAETGVVNVEVTVNDAQDATTSPEDFQFVLMSNQTLLQGPVNGAPTFAFAPVAVGTVFSVQTALDLDELFAQGFSVASTGTCEGNMTTAGATCLITITRDAIVEPEGAEIKITKFLKNDDNTIDPALGIADFQFTVTLGQNLTIGPVSTTQLGTFNGMQFGVITVPVDVETLDFFTGNAPFTVTEVDAKGYNVKVSETCEGTVTYGSIIECEILNDDPEGIVIPEPAELVTIIQVNSDNGGEAIAEDFVVHINGTNPSNNDFPGSDEPGTSTILTANTAYSVSLPADLQGYSILAVGLDCESTSGIAEGETKTCLIILDDIAPQLIIRKDVVIDNPGDSLIDLDRDDFQLFLNGAPTTNDGSAIFVDAGIYTITETSHFGFRGSFSEDCDANGQVRIGVGEVKTCVLTNNDVDPEAEDSARLIVRKIVENDNGGTLGVDDFQLFVNGTALTRQFENNLFVVPGDFTITETIAGNYVGSFTGDCNANGEVTLAAGETKICTLTNRDPGTPDGGDGGPRGDTVTTITIITVVNNNDGKTLTAADFENTLTFTNGPAPVVTPGSTTGVTTTIDPGPFTVEGEDNADYTRSLSGDCATSITLGQDLICTITYDDKAPQGGGSSGGGSRPVPEGGSGGTQSGFFPTPTPTPTPEPTPAPTPTPTPEPIVLGAEDEDTSAGGEEPELPRTGLPAGLLLALPLMLLASVRKNKK